MQRLFFQITITLNPIIIHKLWEKILHQSWWEIKVRRPRHGNDSIFPNTLQRPPLGPLLVTVFKSLTFVLSLVVTRWCDPPEVWGQVAPSAARAEPEPLHRSQTRSSSGIRHQATDRCYWDGDGRGPLNKHTSSQIIPRILLVYDILVWSQKVWWLIFDEFTLILNTPVRVLAQIMIPSRFLLLIISTPSN